MKVKSEFSFYRPKRGRDGELLEGLSSQLNAIISWHSFWFQIIDLVKFPMGMKNWTAAINKLGM